MTNFIGTNCITAGIHEDNKKILWKNMSTIVNGKYFIINSLNH